MTELFIKNKFIQFLKSDKNFSDDSFLLNYHYVDKGGIIYVDLAILDTMYVFKLNWTFAKRVFS